QHKPAVAVSKYLLNKILVARKLDMMEASKAQLRDNEAEMTTLLKNGEIFSEPIDRKGKRPLGKGNEQALTADKKFLSKVSANEIAQAPTFTDTVILSTLSPATTAPAASSSSPVAATTSPILNPTTTAPETTSSSAAATTASTLAPVTSAPEPFEAAEEIVNPIDEHERTELLDQIEQASHTVCEVKIDNICVACSFNGYQKSCVEALVEGKIKKSEIADIMAITGVFAPFLPTPRMVEAIGRGILNELVLPMILPDPAIDDTAVLKAVRLWINNKQEEASEALRGLNRQTRNMFETLLERLPVKQNRSISESTFVVNYVSPVFHGILNIDPRVYSIHFPNTCSEVQRQQGVKPDRPDITIKARNCEILYGEVTGLTHEHNTWKNNWDLYRLARFGKALLNDGFEVAPLVQVVYSNATYMRLTVRARGMYLLQEVESFVIPTTVSMIPALLATLPTLLVAQ
ncbi:hypothetical protein BGW38_003778, partial [Lunasporangiospora selenospora]